MSRLAKGTRGKFKSIEPPKSNFDFVDKAFNGLYSIRRIFSEVRTRGCATIFVEDIPAAGAVANENQEILKYFSDYRMADLKRITFWKNKVSSYTTLRRQKNKDCLGYAIIKHDICPSKNKDNWHVFESLIVPYPGNFLTCAQPVSFRAGDKTFRLSGVLFCQQNELNKRCAQTALRSLCSNILGDPDIAYSKINKLAFQSSDSFTPWAGLTHLQMIEVLSGLNIPCESLFFNDLFEDADFIDLDLILNKLRHKKDSVSKFLWNQFSNKTKNEFKNFAETGRQEWMRTCLKKEFNRVIKSGKLIYKKRRFSGVSLSTDTLALVSGKPSPEHLVKVNRMLIEDAFKKEIRRWRPPYQAMLYCGVESSQGSLLSFSTSGPKANPNEGHVIPVIGHTFNEDMWVPLAESLYFRIGNQTKYIPSLTWLSSFLIHDDNVGSNFCLPKDYFKEKQIDTVIAIKPPGFKISALTAEIIASGFFYSLLKEINPSQNSWLERLLHHAKLHRIILRPVPQTRSNYLKYLSSCKDVWNDKAEDVSVVKNIKKILPTHFWVVEVSIPDLFSANLRKLGDVVIDATDESPSFGCFSETGNKDGDIILKSFVLARFPTSYIFWDSSSNSLGNKQQFIKWRSALDSHTPLIQQR